MNTTQRSMWAKLQVKLTGPGGVKCHCCNSFFGKSKQQLQRLVRRLVKQDTDKQIKELE